MFFRMIYDDLLAQAAYLIGCQRTGQAIVIDAERDVDRYVEAAAANKLRIVAVAETHIHADFLAGTRELAEAVGAKVFVSDEGDADWKYGWLKSRSDGGSYDHQLLRDGGTFQIGHIHFKAIHTPGHTPEHICFLVTDRGGGADEPMGLISGDFVFVGDLGRPDLLETAAGIAGAKERSARNLFRSAERFRQLPDYLQLWPAHGAGSACGKALGAVPQSTVGYEKRFNAALLAGDDGEAAFVRNILEGQPEPPLYFARMKAQNRHGPALLGHLPQPRELDVAALRRVDAPHDYVLDTRPWAHFRAGHVPGSLHTPLNNSFPAVAGSYLEASEASVHLIVAPSDLDAAVRNLVRVGIDSIVSFATPQTLALAASQGMSLASIEEIDVREFRKRQTADGALVLDVRRNAEYQAGHIDGALNIVHTRLPAHLDELPRHRPLLVHCQGGVRSALAAALLARQGFKATNIAGGFGAWEAAGCEVVREAVVV